MLILKYLKEMLKKWGKKKKKREIIIFSRVTLSTCTVLDT